MTILTREQNRTVQAYLQLATKVLNRHGLEMFAGADLNDYKDHYHCVEGRLRVPKTHDPDHCYCHPDNAFWVGFRPLGEEKPVALCAHRTIDTEDLFSELYTHRLFSDASPVIDAYEYDLEDGLPHLAGRLGSNGGIVVALDWRGRQIDGWPDMRLGGLIARVSQALSIRMFQIDFQFSFSRTSPERRAMASNGYGMAHSVLAMTGMSPITETVMDLRLNWTSRMELLDRMSREVETAGRRYGNA